ncbi:hypothetical protein [Virgibacillus salexigens]|nr:hypothetical protein [Virgibacillus kapii]GGJ52515.1 hypothetical protein GCM10007111_13340 [Virgibacillus kapii]
MKKLKSLLGVVTLVMVISFIPGNLTADPDLGWIDGGVSIQSADPDLGWIDGGVSIQSADPDLGWID